MRNPDSSGAPPPSISVVCAALALYLNVFVLIVQLFQKVPALKALAPTQSEPPFLLTQVLGLALFVALTIVALVRLRSEAARTNGTVREARGV